MDCDFAPNAANIQAYLSDDSVLSIETFVKVLKHILLFLSIYLVGYFGFSIIWAYAIAFLVFLNYKRVKEKRSRLELNQAMALGFEQELILKIFSELPIWVRFPDVEKVDWFNKVFKQLWAEFSQYIEDLLPKVLEPLIQYYVADFKFEKIVLGNVPIQINGVKVYDPENGNKVVLDLDISYVGNCYVTFQTFKFVGGIKDIQLHGRLRIVLTPLISKSPIFGGVQIYFMTPPRIDFDLIKTTYLLDVPVIRTKIENTATNLINSMFLFPNIYTLKLNNRIDMSKLNVFKVDGVLRVHVVEAQNLVNKDFIGKSDPYVVLTLGSIKKETPVIQNCLNPKWDYWCEFESEAHAELHIGVWDRDEGTKDETLGFTKIDIGHVAKNGEINIVSFKSTDTRWRKLEDVSKGTIHIRLTWLSFTTNLHDLPAIVKETELLNSTLHTAVLMVYLDSSCDLPTITKSLPDPYVELRVENEIRTSEVEKCTCGPIWEKGFTFMLRDPRSAILELRVLDQDSKRSLGSLTYSVNNLGEFPNLQIKRQSFFLSAVDSDASITFSLQLKILKNKFAEEVTEMDLPKKSILVKQDSTISVKTIASQKSLSGDSDSIYSDETVGSLNMSIDQDDSGLGNLKLSLSYSAQRQRLVIIIHELDLPLKTPTSYLDAHLNLYVQTGSIKHNKEKTKVIKHSYNPVFDETFEYLISAKDLSISHLVIEVITERKMLQMSKKILGKVAIALTKSEKLNVPFTHWFNLTRRKNPSMYHLN